MCLHVSWSVWELCPKPHGYLLGIMCLALVVAVLVDTLLNRFLNIFEYNFTSVLENIQMPPETCS